MLVKNKKSSEIESLRHGPATDAVSAGTHDFVNVGGDGKPLASNSKVKAETGGSASEASSPAAVPEASGVDGKRKES